MANRIDILKESLTKKEMLFEAKLTNHIDTVKQANGQPLNDKRNGYRTLNKWDKQNDSLRTLNNSIEVTKQAIEKEASTIAYVERIKKDLPIEILNKIESGELIQWRKHPNTFFVAGVDKARLVWDNKNQIIAHKFVGQISDKDQYSKFAAMFNSLKRELIK